MKGRYRRIRGCGYGGLMFSRTAVTNSLLTKLIPKKPEAKVPIEQLESVYSYYHIKFMEGNVMSKILELREKRAKAWEAAKKFLDSKRGEDGLLSAEDTAAYERWKKKWWILGRRSSAWAAGRH